MPIKLCIVHLPGQLGEAIGVPIMTLPLRLKLFITPKLLMMLQVLLAQWWTCPATDFWPYFCPVPRFKMATVVHHSCNRTRHAKQCDSFFLFQRRWRTYYYQKLCSSLQVLCILAACNSSYSFVQNIIWKLSSHMYKDYHSPAFSHTIGLYDIWWRKYGKIFLQWVLTLDPGKKKDPSCDSHPQGGLSS